MDKSLLLEQSSRSEESTRSTEMRGGLSRLRGLAMGSVLVLIGQAACLFSGVLSNFLVARLVGPDGKGVIYLIQVASGIALIVCNCGVGIAGVYYLSKRTSVREVAAAMLLLSLAGGFCPILLGTFAWGWIVPAIHSKIEPRFLIVAVVSVPFFVLSWNASYFELGRHEVGVYNILRIAQSLVFALLLLAMTVTSNRNVIVVSILWLISVAISGVWAVHRFIRTGMRLFQSFTSLTANLLRYGLHSQAGAITQYLQHRIDVLLVGYFLPVREIGIYSLAVGLAELLWNVPHAVGAVLMPHIAISSEEHAKNVTPMVCRLTLFVGAVLSLIAVLLGGAAISAFLPAFNRSIALLWLLTPGVVAAIVFKVLISDYTARGKALATLYPASASLIFAMFLGIYFIPRYGIKAAAIITSLSYIFNATLFIMMYVRETSTSAAKMVLIERHDFAVLGAGAKHILRRSLGRIGLTYSNTMPLPEA